MTTLKQGEELDDIAALAKWLSQMHIASTFEEDAIDLFKFLKDRGISRHPDAALAQKAGRALEEIICNWPEDAEWKPVQSLLSIDDRMCFPVEAVLAGQDLRNCKDYILRDVVERALSSLSKAQGKK